MATRSEGFLTISVDTRRAEDHLNNLSIKLPQGAMMGAKRIAGNYALEYLKQMRESGIHNWTGRSANILRNQINNPTKLENGYGIVVPLSLILLDSMKTHVVPLRRNSTIGRWAKSHGFRGGFLTVHKHPWINQANFKAQIKNNSLMLAEIKKAKLRSK